MWVFLPWGFFSIVGTKNSRQPDLLAVRGRRRDHIEAFCRAAGASTDGIIDSMPGTRDYQHRVFLTVEQVALALCEASDQASQYTNFKAEVAKSDEAFASVCQRVWGDCLELTEPSNDSGIGGAA